jgi:hypothetical protein
MPDQNSSNHVLSPEPTLQDGIAMRESEQLDASRRILELVVEQEIRMHGRESFDAQCALSQLGRTLRGSGNVAAAVELHWEVLATRFRLHGRHHAFTQNSAAILAESLRMQQDGETASRLERWASNQEVEQSEETEFIEMRLGFTSHGRHSQANPRIDRLIDAYLQRPRSDRYL